MTESEAIKTIEDYVEECNYTWTVEQLFAEYVKRRNKSYVSYTADDVIDHCWSAFKFLEVKALNEVLEYQKLGTVEECREAIEKTKEKKCVKDSCPDHTHYKCPTCGKIQKTEYDCGTFGCILNNCSNCGQRLERE